MSIDKNKKVVSIHQPQYWPWAGLINKIAGSDIHVFLDNVQFHWRGFQHRTLYKIFNAPKTKYLTLPYNKEDKRCFIKDVNITGKDWIDEHNRVIQENYRVAPYFEEYIDEIRNTLNKGFSLLGDISMASTEKLSTLLGLDVVFMKASELDASGHKSGLILDIVKKVGGEVYYSGQGARNYMDDEAFRKEGIEVFYQEFVHPLYRQQGPGFIEGCSVMDMVFNEGPEESSRLIRESSPEWSYE